MGKEKEKKTKLKQPPPPPLLPPYSLNTLSLLYNGLLPLSRGKIKDIMHLKRFCGPAAQVLLGQKMALVGLLCLCLLASLVGSYPLTDESSNFEGPIFIPVSIGRPTAEEVSIGIPTAEEVSIGIPTAEEVSIGRPTAEEVSIGIPTAEEVSIGRPTAEEVSIGIPTAEEVSIGIPTAEDMKEHEADTKIGAIAPRSLKSLFGLGIGGNLLGINAGAGISHGRGGWGEVGMHSGHPAYVPYYEEPNQY
ncbi:hypothetical protein J6590_078445 [Homalodisca vitripennis]|nr:hypothetical protein J6590_078445 [Homalodisca vitripennis]